MVRRGLLPPLAGELLIHNLNSTIARHSQRHVQWADDSDSDNVPEDGESHSPLGGARTQAGARCDSDGHDDEPDKLLISRNRSFPWRTRASRIHVVY
jgi:hypothetical protein